MKAVSQVVRLILDALVRQVRPGVATVELDAAAATLMAAHGARSAPALVYGFPGTVLISINDEVVHGIPGARVIAPGDLVKIDVTVEKDGYVADAARTVVAEPGSSKAYELAACASAAFARACRSRGPEQRSTKSAVRFEREVRRRGFTVVSGLAGPGVGRTIHEPPSCRTNTTASA